MQRRMLIKLLAAICSVSIFIIHHFLSDSRVSNKVSNSFPLLDSYKFLLESSGFPRSSCDCDTVAQSTHNFDALSGELVGFFNVFKKDAAVFNRVVSEQISMLESAGLVAATKEIHVVYIGPQSEKFQVNSTSLKFIVSHKSNATGNEAVTLQLLHDHCKSNPEDRIFYIHSKGTYHSDDANELLRQNLMRAIVACWQLDGLSRSDVCGLRASPLPHPHFSGNMWWARCAYISKLLRPDTFEAVMDRRLADMLAGHPPGNRTPKCIDAWVGSGRFAAEHWVLSHPSAVVTDVLPAWTGGDPPVYAWAYDGMPRPDRWQPDLQTVPRADIPALWFFGKDLFYVYALRCSHESHRRREYRALYGPGALRGLPCRSMYCQWHPLAFLQLSNALLPRGFSLVKEYLADMRAVGAGQSAGLAGSR